MESIFEKIIKPKNIFLIQLQFYDKSQVKKINKKKFHNLFVRVFGKDEEGCIHPDEIKYVLRHLPSELENDEIEEMIEIVDRNKDGKISYSEFRVNISLLSKLNKNYVYNQIDFGFQVMLGAIPLLIPDNPAILVETDDVKQEKDKELKEPKTRKKKRVAE